MHQPSKRLVVFHVFHRCFTILFGNRGWSVSILVWTSYYSVQSKVGFVNKKLKSNFQQCLCCFDRWPVDLVGHRHYCLSLKCVGLVLFNHSDSNSSILSVSTSKRPTRRDNWWHIVSLCKLCDSSVILGELCSKYMAMSEIKPPNQLTSLTEEQAPMLAKVVVVLTQSLLAILELQKWLVRDPTYPHLFARKVWHTFPMMKSVWYLSHIELAVFQAC